MLTCLFKFFAKIVDAYYISECVPVIIDYNYVLPFSDVLNWKSLLVQVSKEDIPNLKSILMSISSKLYKRMQKAGENCAKTFHG